MSVTIEMPSLLTLRTRFKPGTPAMPRSMGSVICDSTSVADNAAARVTTCTWMFVTSGTASMARRCAALTPTAMTPMQIMRETKAFFAAHSTRPFTAW